MSEKYYQPAKKEGIIRVESLTAFEAEQAVAMALTDTAPVDAFRALIAKHKALLEAAHRSFLAATGTCPDCGHEMTVEPECEVSDPPHTGETRTAPAALCGNCDTCIEL